MAYVDPPVAVEGTALTVDVIGEARSATVVPSCRFDPDNQRVRA